MAEDGEGDAKYLAALLAANEKKWSSTPTSVVALKAGEVTPVKEGALSKPEVVSGAAGSLTIDTLRKHLEMQAENASAKRQECEAVIAGAVPTEPDPDTLKLLIKAGLPEAKAREGALASEVIFYYEKKANAQAGLDYLRMLEKPGTNFDSIPYLGEAIDVYNRQFSEMARLLGIDLSQPSKLDPNLTIEQEYQRRLTPLPRELKGLFLNQGTQATVNYRPWYSEVSTPGVFFTFPVEYNEDRNELRVTHGNNMSKAHEDSHFLALALKGEEKYYHGEGLGMLGEGLAPIFELWFAGSAAEGKDVLTETSLVNVNKGESPVGLENALGLTPDNPEWWDKAKGQSAPAINEKTQTTRISAEIMKLMQNNPDITFIQLYKLYLEAETLEGFFGKVEASGKGKNGMEESKEAINRLCWSVDRNTDR